MRFGVIHLSSAVAHQIVIQSCLMGPGFRSPILIWVTPLMVREKKGRDRLYLIFRVRPRTLCAVATVLENSLIPVESGVIGQVVLPAHKPK